MATMDEKYGDGTECLACEECGLCIDHGDCKANGCGKEVGKPRKSSRLMKTLKAHFRLKSS